MNRSLIQVFGCSAVGLLITAQACSPATIGEGIRPEAPTGVQALEPGESAVCSPDAPMSILSVDLPSSVRVALESGMKQGVVVVAHDCKRLRVLESCQLPGDYTFAGVTRKEDVVTLRDLTELQANLPLGAVQLATQIESGTSIHLALVQIGTRRTLFNEVGRAELQGACEGATHFLRGTIMGAPLRFAFAFLFLVSSSSRHRRSVHPDFLRRAESRPDVLSENLGERLEVRSIPRGVGPKATLPDHRQIDGRDRFHAPRGCAAIKARLDGVESLQLSSRSNRGLGTPSTLRGSVRIQTWNPSNSWGDGSTPYSESSLTYTRRAASSRS